MFNSEGGDPSQGPHQSPFGEIVGTGFSLWRTFYQSDSLSHLVLSEIFKLWHQEKFRGICDIAEILYANRNHTCCFWWPTLEQLPWRRWTQMILYNNRILLKWEHTFFFKVRRIKLRLLLLYSYSIRFHPIISELMYFLNCDLPWYCMVYRLDLHPAPLGDKLMVPDLFTRDSDHCWRSLSWHPFGVIRMISLQCKRTMSSE